MDEVFIKILYDRYKEGKLNLADLFENVRAEVQKLIDAETESEGNK